MEEYLNNLVIFIIFITLTSCSRERTDFIGSYSLLVETSEESKKKDSLIININETYYHLLYSIKGNCVIYENQGKWAYDDKYLVLYGFKNDYYNSECQCNEYDDCYLSCNAYFGTNAIGTVKFLYQDVNILEGINYKRISKD